MNYTRRTQIIKTAARLFREKGYTDVTMRDLAKDLNIKAASLYNHITSKSELLSAIIMGLAEEFTTHIQSVRQKAATSLDKLEETIAMHIEITIERTNSLACMNKEWRYLDDANKKVFQDLRNAYESEFMAIVTQGIKAGELKLQDAKIFSNSTLSVLRTLYHWYETDTNGEDKYLVENLTQNLLYGAVNTPVSQT